MKDEKVNSSLLKIERDCLLQKIPCFPYPGMTLFWKMCVGVTAVLMLIFSLTLWSMAAAMNRLAIEQHETKSAVESHIKLTLENRVVQSRIEGLFLGFMDRYRISIPEIPKQGDK